MDSTQRAQGEQGERTTRLIPGSRGPWGFVGGIAGVLLAAWLGIDVLSGSDGDTSAQQAPASVTTTSSTAAAQQARGSQAPTTKPTRAAGAKPPKGTATASPKPRPEATTPAQRQPKGPNGMSVCPLGTLPKQATETAKDILHGGPFAHPDNDGVRFGNYENVLPQQNRNYYREYTVDTPGLNHRGARRIVTGGGSDTDPNEWFYTSDHYESFCFIPDAEEVLK